MKEGELEIGVGSLYKNLVIIRSVIRTFLEVEMVSKLDKVQLVSVADELSTNAIEHAYENEKEFGTINIVLKIKENIFTMIVEDYGQGFLENKISKEEGGLGLNIVKGIVDDFAISRKEQGTKIKILKKVNREERIVC
ncbi:ATP-binding protein [Haliovirga abyssi]|uniref:Anti-sigma B factor n=1 Tax=Haliovirga abyssi TaxID=2996794 RepID=A0AAU9DX86_9FUSO|nr:ATP-binding protein [Haliovirga abyssi]BDU51016.1 anti-sigma B factor [Haliovirga abyssi]